MRVSLLPEGSASLCEKSEKVSYKEALEIVKKLRWIIAHAPWGNPVGMAAPQIGINKRVFVALNKAYINPTLVRFNLGGTSIMSEGCYSIPHQAFSVKRHDQVRVTYTNEAGDRVVETLHGWEARVVQHEYDHIEGILIDSPRP